MTEDETFRKLRKTPFHVVDADLRADYASTQATWYVDYLNLEQGNSASILDEHGWTKAEFQTARWQQL